jgi:hypothetical protein
MGCSRNQGRWTAWTDQPKSGPWRSPEAEASGVVVSSGEDNSGNAQCHQAGILLDKGRGTKGWGC